MITATLHIHNKPYIFPNTNTDWQNQKQYVACMDQHRKHWHEKQSVLSSDNIHNTVEKTD